MESNWGEGQGSPWYSDDGRYMLGINLRTRGTAWIIDTRTGKVVNKSTVPKSDWYEVKWVKGRFEIYEGFPRKLLVIVST